MKKMTQAEIDERALQQWRESTSVSRFQARAALRKAGLRDQVETMMTAPETDPVVVDAWNDAIEFRRLSPTVQSMGAALGLSDEQLDNLFVQAQGIDA